MGNTSDINLIKLIAIALNDATHLVRGVLYSIPEYKEKAHDEQSLSKKDVFAFYQTSSNTSCGWGGIAGQAFTDYHLVCLHFPALKVAVVYITGRPAYICKADGAFYQYIEMHQLPDYSMAKSGNMPLTFLWIWEAPNRDKTAEEKRLTMR